MSARDSRSWRHLPPTDTQPIRTIVFDLDGTLYEDPRVYDRYVEELAALLPAERRESFLAEWERTKQGAGVARIGMGYDVDRDLLFRWSRKEITGYHDWEGNEVAVEAALDDEPLFGVNRLLIGDWWRYPDVLATHHGLAPELRGQAFAATRDYMASDEFELHLEPGMRELLADLQAAGIELVAMSNSPPASVDAVFDELGIREYFHLIIAGANKPLGMERWLEASEHPEQIISVGDFYTNEIEPALIAGGQALYIDRHDTGLGSEYPRCHRVPSIPAAATWLRQHTGIVED